MINIKPFLDYGGARKRIVYWLINTERNRMMLGDMPHMEFLDLSIVFGIMIPQREPGMAVIPVRSAHMKLWGITVEELYRAAGENTQRLAPYGIKSVAEILRETMKKENPEGYGCDTGLEEFPDSMPLYVISNKNRIQGAACMLYPGLLRRLSDTAGCSLYIIPSSVHELLILPAGDREMSGELKCMIREINDAQVQPDEILSYSLYYYDREERRIRIC